MLREGNMSQAERIIEACGDTLTRAEKRRIMRNCGEFKKRNGRR
jgi:hypothetical protein